MPQALPGTVSAPTSQVAMSVPDDGVTSWAPGQTVALGDERSYNGVVYTVSQVEGLDDALADKASTQELADGLAGKADVAVVDSRPALFSGTGAPPSAIPNARVGDWWLNTTAMELHKITGV